MIEEFGRFMVQGADGAWVSPNERQLGVLVEQELVNACPSGLPHYHARKGLSAEAIMEILLAGHPELMDCEFCAEHDAAWVYPTRERVKTLRANTVHTSDVPPVACDACSTLIENGKREALFQRIADLAIGRILDGTSHMVKEREARVRENVEAQGFEAVLPQAIQQAREIHGPFFTERAGDRVPFDGGRGIELARKAVHDA